MNDELTLEDLDEILGEENPYDRYRSSYVKFSVRGRDCSYPDCGEISIALIQDIAFCAIHSIQTLGDMLDGRINMYPNRKERIDFILQSHLNMLEGEEAPQLNVPDLPISIVTQIRVLHDTLYQLNKGDFRNAR